MSHSKQIMVLFLPVLFLICGCQGAMSPKQVSGELQKWHNVTLTFEGPESSETATPNPFLDYRLNVTFKHAKSGTTYVVPGYYAADGDAANSSSDSGNKWRVHFAPDQIGIWEYQVSFRQGKNIAVNDEAGTSAKFMDGKDGSFKIKASDKKGRDFRAKGRLDYVGGHYLQFAGNKEYFLKQGADAPENLLAYADFDGDFKTDGHKDNFIKTWQPHIKDWKPGDPTWQDGKGKGLIGAVNYLASEGMNVFSFLTMNINGDDQNAFPYTTYGERSRMDVSRLGQWEILFEHADTLGMFLHFKTMETENEMLLDGGDLGTERKLYYRELIARFGHHLALNWNLGEEINNANTAQKKSWAQYFYDTDPYHHHIVIHNMGEPHYDLLGPGSKLTGFSLQTNKADFSRVHSQVLNYLKRSVEAGKPWAVACDEPGDATHSLVPDKDDPTHDNARMNGLWGALMAGGWGCEWYFGYKHDHSDLTCQDFRSRDDFWDQCRYALQFFDKQDIPFWEMKSKDDLTWEKNDYCFIKDGQIYLIYQKQGGVLNLDLSDGKFEYGYLNTRTGEGVDKLLNEKKVAGPTKYTFTAPDDKDWLLVIRSPNGGKVTQTEKPKTTETAAKTVNGLVLSALNDFEIISGDRLVPAYKDNGRKALAINAAQYKDKFAAAETVYNGENGTYTLVLTALTEADGESTYKLFVNGKQIGSAQNPATSDDYDPVPHVWENVALNKGDKIQIHFNTASNKNIPEGDGFAYSRGRWTSLTIGDASTTKKLQVDAPIPTDENFEDIVKIESLYTGQIFEEVDGLLAVEAEHFSEQTKTDKRQWYIVTTEGVPGIAPDGDPSHAADASGGAYIEILPDTRRTHADKLTSGVNFSNEPGVMAVLSYPVHINTPGRYYVWVRAYSTGAEDNGLHVGIDGTWPETGARLQWCQGKNSWRWESKQRTAKVHCGEPYKIFLDIEKPGPHLIQFSMREDGFEFDKFILTKEKEFERPADTGPVSVVSTSSTEDADLDEGFTRLFNGKNFDGWYLKIKSGDAELAKKVYAIEDGMVHVFKDFPDEFELGTGKNETHGLFYTKKKYSKYIFRFEYKWGTKIGNNFSRWQYDAGCYYHVYDDKIWPKGIEYQVRYDHTKDKNHTGDFITSNTSLRWFADKKSETFLLPKDGGVDMGQQRQKILACSADAKHNALNDKWNQCEIIVMGDQYTIHKLNGQIVNMGTDLSHSEGIIGLQSETAEIYYRNIEIKEFDEVVPMERFL